MDLKKKAEEIFDVTAEPAADIVSSMFLEGLAGSIVPGVTSAMLAYKQKRSERMIERFMIETKKRQDELEEKLVNREEKDFKEIKDKYFGIVLDYVVETKQEEKIKYLVNGFINLADMKNLQEDVVLIFYDILSELNVLDIRVLKTYDYFPRVESYSDIVSEVGIDNEQYNLIQNKLERLELIENRAKSQYEEMFQNVSNILDYLSKIEKGKKANLKYKKPNTVSIKTYSLTKLGRQFIKFFSEEHS